MLVNAIDHFNDVLSQKGSDHTFTGFGDPKLLEENYGFRIGKRKNGKPDMDLPGKSFCLF